MVYVTFLWNQNEINLIWKIQILQSAGRSAI